MTDHDNPLDRLTRPGGRSLSDDESIPVLTERLTLPSLDLDISLPKAPPVAAPAPAPASASPSPPPAPPPASSTPRAAALTSAGPPTRPVPATVPSYTSAPPSVPDIDWTRLEQSVRDAVIRDLQPAIADEAGRLLRERLPSAIDRLATALATELRQTLEARLRETVARAVAAEVARLKERPRS